MQKLYKELEQLNRKIDKKILAGQTYKKEAEEHKNLTVFITHHENNN